MATRPDRPQPPRRRGRLVRAGIGAAVLVLLVAQLGAEPFLAALTSVTPWALALAALVTVATTTCCAWRWTTVARGLGLHLPLPTAVAACYRSLLLNSTLPGGVLGDVDRAVRHGLDSAALGRSARAVVWERTLGQVVQVALTLLLLLVLPSPVPGAVVVVAAVGVGLLLVVAGVLLLARSGPSGHRRAVPRALGAVQRDLRRVLPDLRARSAVALASVLVVAGHVGVLLLAMHVTGVPASGTTRLWLALVVLLAAAVPASLAGWGPREGAAAWVFGAAGLGAGTGVTVAVGYGVLTLVATLPGVVVLLGPRSGARRPARDQGHLAHPSGAQPVGPEPVGRQQVVEGGAPDLGGDRRTLRGEQPQQ